MSATSALLDSDIAAADETIGHMACGSCLKLADLVCADTEVQAESRDGVRWQSSRYGWWLGYQGDHAGRCKCLAEHPRC